LSRMKAHPDRGVIVTSRKRGKVERRMAAERGVQRAAAAKRMQRLLDERIAARKGSIEPRIEVGMPDVSGSMGWTDESVRDLVAEVTGKGSASRPRGVE
jgi:hypothetical protein